MLPVKMELTEELAATLRQLRLDHPINGEVLTAENLSKAIGNNRAWMSQIESRRLKKIKREDIIKIYKLLYNEPNDYQAEYRAEIDLMQFLCDSNEENSTFITGGSISSQYSDDAYNEYRSKHGGINYTNEDLLREKKQLMETATSIVNNFMEELKNIPSCLEHNNYINQFMELEDYLRDYFKDMMFVIDSLPLYALQYATEEEHEDFIKSIENISHKLKGILEKHDFESFITDLNAAKIIMDDYPRYRKDIPKDKLLKDVTVLLVNLSQYVTDENLLSMSDKIQYTNDMIYIVYCCSTVVKSNQLFNVKELPTSATINDIYNKINELQLFLSNIEDNPVVIMGQISKYFTT